VDAPLQVVAQTTSTSPLISRLAPNFVLKDLNRERMELRDYRGKVVLLNFWATWCGPCKIEMPKFDAWQKQYGGEQFQVLGISMDDSEMPVQAEERRLKLDYPLAMGDPKMVASYGGILGLPVTFLIDRKGKIQAKYLGAADLQSMEQEIKILLRRQ